MTSRSRTGKRWLLMAGGALVAAPLAMAPSRALAQTQASDVRNFDVPSQALSSGLLRFGEQAGLQFSLDSKLVEGKTANALHGRYSVEEGLRQLLAGSGLSYRFTGAKTVAIEVSADLNGERVTGAVKVEGAQGSPYFGGAGVAAGVNGVNGSRDMTATEGTGSFTSGALTIGSKVPQALKDVPQSISVLTSERLEEQHITDFTSALAQLPGVALTQGDSSLETVFYSRGFQITSIQVDGGAPLTTRFANVNGIGFFPQIDMSIYDHVELLRGADGLFNGYGDPGGTVNLVRKKPLDHAQFTLDAQAASWDNYRLVADATAPLAFDGKLRGRLVMTWQDNHHFYNIAKDNKSLVYGILELDVTPTTLLTAGVNYTQQNSTPWEYGLPRYQTGADLMLPRSTSLAFPWNRWDFKTTEYFAGLEQKIGKDWTLKINLTDNSQSSVKKLGYSYGPVNPANKLGPVLEGVDVNYASKQLSVEAVLSGAFDVFGQRQEITIGINRSDQDAGGYSPTSGLTNSSYIAPYQPYPGGPQYCYTTSTTQPCPAGTIAPGTPPINVFNFNPNDPIYTEPRPGLPYARYPVDGQIQDVAYLNVRLTAFNRLHLTTGIHWSDYEYRSEEQDLCADVSAGCQIGAVTNDTRLFYTGHQFSWPPSATLSYDVTKALTAYVGYTDIYQDQSSSLGSDLKPIGPVTGSNWEAGLKWAPRNGRLNLSLAAYRTRQKGFGTPDGDYDDDGNFVASNGKVFPNGGQIDAARYCCYKSDPNNTLLSQGVDLEATGEILPGLQAAASYTYNENKYEGSSNGSLSGTPLVSIQPRSLYKLWVSYDFGAKRHDGVLSRLSVSGGVNGQSSGYRSGSACLPDHIATNPATGASSCLRGGSYIYAYTIEPYAVFSGRIDYHFSRKWALALNVENILDKTYYQTVSSPSLGNWYGAPRSFTVSVHAKW